jgi:hypothetical protein
LIEFWTDTSAIEKSYPKVIRKYISEGGDMKAFYSVANEIREKAKKKFYSEFGRSFWNL